MSGDTQSRYLVTGAQGFVGRYVVAELLRGSCAQILGLGRSQKIQGQFTHRLASGKPAPLPVGFESVEASSRYEYGQCDLADVDALTKQLASFQPTHVIHLASGLFGDEPRLLFRTNVEGTLNLFTALGRTVEAGRCKVVLGSSGGVYGAAQEQPLRELTLPEPLHYYTASKLSEEHAATAAARELDFELCVARIFNVVGAGLDERHACAQWLSRLHDLAQSCAPVSELTTGDLRSTRDFIDVRDVATGCCVLADAGLTGEVYNLASGVETAMSDVLRHCQRLADPHNCVAVRSVESTDNMVPRNVANIGKIRALNWQPEFRLEQSLSALHCYYMALATAGASECA